LGDAVLTTLVLICALGVLPALAIVRRLLFAIPLAAATTVIVSGLGALVGTLLGVSITASVLVIAAIADALAVWSLWRGRRTALVTWARRDVLVSDGIMVCATVIPAVLLMTLFAPMPLGGDPIAIWWFHASWFYAGGETTRHLIANPAVAYSHVNYPPGVPAAQAVAWVLHGGKDFPLAQDVSSILGGFAIAGVVLILWSRQRTLGLMVAGAALIAAMSGLDMGLSASGYMDLLNATFVVTTGCALLYIQDRRLCLSMGCLCLAAASLTKGEGLLFGVVVVAVALVWRRELRVRIFLLSALAIVPAILWQLVVYSLNPNPYVDISATDFLHLLGARDRGRLHVAAPHIFGASYPILFAATAVVGLLVVAALVRHPRGPSFPALAPALGLLVLGYLTALADALVYAAGRWPSVLSWLGASLDRTILTSRIFGLTAIVAALPLCMQLAYRPRGAAVEAEDGTGYLSAVEASTETAMTSPATSQGQGVFDAGDR